MVSKVDLTKVPHKPGVYIYKDSEGKVLYVGKAIDLRSRVSSYFQTRVSLKTAHMVAQISDAEWVIVESELEALVLEANLIKKHLPPYNVRLTDDKDYLYIKVTKESFPKIITARKQELKGSLDYFGPFPSSRTVRETLKKLRRVFPWCSAPATNSRLKPCFYYHLGLCPGACLNKISPEDYKEPINRFRRFMSGGGQELIDELTIEMNQASTSMQYERAGALKKAIEGIQYLLQPNRASVYLENPNFLADETQRSLEDLKDKLKLSDLPDRVECFDISNIQGSSAVGSMVVLTSGEIDKSQYRKFKIRATVQTGKPNDFAMIKEIVTRRLRNDWPLPQLMLIDGGIGQVRAAREVLIERQLEIPVFGLAKREEWLYTPDGVVIKLPRKSLGLKLFQKIRDEAHRFAITYHRKLRTKAAFS